MPRKVVIIGGVAGGASAAARLRRLDENARIVLLERGEHISFANCGLPYYISRTIAEKEKLLVQTPQAMKKRFNIDVRVNSEAVRIHREEKQVEILDRQTGQTYRESYDELILSPGCSPMQLPIPGIDNSRVFFLTTVRDTLSIKEFIEKNHSRSAVIVGGGFIGLEAAENLHMAGLKVTIVEMADQVMGALDYDMAAMLHQHLQDQGITLLLAAGIKEVKETGEGLEVETSAGTLAADLLIMTAGVQPNIRLAAEAELQIGPSGGIAVDEFLRTSDPSIYAVGDAIEVKNLVTGIPSRIPLAGPANKQGRMAANNLCGFSEKYTGTQGTSIIKLFDMAAAVTGMNERALKKAGIPYVKSYTHSASHATYYPGATQLSLKLLFTPDDGKLLGAQIVGKEGVDKRMDVLATALRLGATVYDLEKLELAYAPPFSSAKDPVNMAGYVASNILKGDCSVFHWHELEKACAKDAVLIDVRTKKEHDQGHIPKSLLIPVDELRDRLDEIPRDKQIYIYCQVGLRGYLACRILKQSGYDRIFNLSGGYRTYSSIPENVREYAN